MKKVVLDANVYVKLFKKEADSEQAINLLEKLVRESVPILEPSIVVNETITTCEVNGQDIRPVCDLFNALLKSNISLVEMNSDLIQSTFAMTQQGHTKSGFPTFNDSLYQVLAIQQDALLITADKRHFAKTQHLGNIALLGTLTLNS